MRFSTEQSVVVVVALFALPAVAAPTNFQSANFPYAPAVAARRAGTFLTNAGEFLTTTDAIIKAGGSDIKDAWTQSTAQ